MFNFPFSNILCTISKYFSKIILRKVLYILKVLIKQRTIYNLLSPKVAFRNYYMLFYNILLVVINLNVMLGAIQLNYRVYKIICKFNYFDLFNKN